MPSVPPGAPRIRILFLAANPVTTTALKLAQEVRQIEEQLRAAKHRDTIEFTAKWAVRIEDLRHALLDVAPHIVHFSGHGSEAEGIYLESPEGICAPVDHASLVELLVILKENIRLVVLNACQTRSLAEAIAAHIDCAIGMRTDVGDEAAIEFSAAFYQAIGSGRSVKVAFDLGRNALKLKKIPEDLTPELYLRSSVDPGQITLVRPHLDPGDNELPAPPLLLPANPRPTSPSDSGLIRLPSLSDSGSIRIRGPTSSDPVLAIDPTRASRPSDPTRQDHRARWRLGLRARLGVALVVIACVAGAALLWIRARRPPPIEPFPPAASGVVLSGAWMATAQGEAFCDAVREILGSEAVRCQSFASRQPDDPGVRARARRAGAMVVVLVSDDGSARVFPLGLFDGNPLVGGEFGLDVGRVEARKRTVALLAALARVARPRHASAPDEVPCPPMGNAPLDRLTLLAQLFVPSCAREAIASQRLLEVCDTPASNAEDCGLARSIFVARCPTCPDARAALTWLKEKAHPRFRPMATVQLARMDCEDARHAEASAALRSLAEDPSACVEIAAAAVAACVVSAAGPKQRVDAEIRALEQTPMLDRLECPPVLRTKALGERAYYRARGKQWDGAEADYRAAFTLSQEPLYELSRIELLLRQRRWTEARQALEALDHLTIEGPQNPAYAALLRWIAARDAGGTSVKLDATALVELYRALPSAARALGDASDEDLRALACPKAVDAPCAYDILARPKTSTSVADLERALASER